MNAVTIRDDDKNYIDEQIEAGNYTSADDVIHVGLTLLRKEEAKLAAVRALIQEGLDDIEAGRTHTYESPEALLADIQAMSSVDMKKQESGH